MKSGQNYKFILKIKRFRFQRKFALFALHGSDKMLPFALPESHTIIGVFQKILMTKNLFPEDCEY